VSRDAARALGWQPHVIVRVHIAWATVETDVRLAAMKATMTRPTRPTAYPADRLPKVDETQLPWTSSIAAPRPSTIVVISDSVITNGGET